MKRNYYEVRSYDGKITKGYRNYQSAYNYCSKLIAQDINCGIYQFNFDTNEMEIIIGC